MSRNPLFHNHIHVSSDKEKEKSENALKYIPFPICHALCLDHPISLRSLALPHVPLSSSLCKKKPRSMSHVVLVMGGCDVQQIWKLDFFCTVDRCRMRKVVEGWMRRAWLHEGMSSVDGLSVPVSVSASVSVCRSVVHPASQQ